MKFRINYTNKALSDLDGIYDYISFTLKEPSIAENLIKCILQSVRSLEEMPNRHRLCDEEVLRNQNIRIMPVKNYIIAYVADDKKKTVSVLRVMYGGRDISKQLHDML